MKRIIATIYVVGLIISCSLIVNPLEAEEYSDISVYTVPNVYKKLVVVENVERAIETEEVAQPQYGFTYDEVYLLAQLLCGSSTYDGDGEYDFVYGAKRDETNYCEISKVLCVVMNRVRSSEFPDTVTDVVMQKGQFSVMPKNSKKVPDDIAIEKVQEWCDAYDLYVPGVQSIPESHLYFCAGPNLTNVTREQY